MGFISKYKIAFAICFMTPMTFGFNTCATFDILKARSKFFVAKATSPIDDIETSRRSAIQKIMGSSMLPLTTRSVGAIEKDDIIMYKTGSGLQYREIVEGSGPSPRYGQYVTFSYKGFVSLAGDSKDKKLSQFDEVSSYLTKHGNGRLIAGLDEGLHTMKVGGKRRLIIPPKLGYVESGLGPIPEGWLARRNLSELLDEMVARSGGRIVFDIELLAVKDDEADQGYYEDFSLTPEEFNTLRMNMQGSQASNSD